MSKQKQNPLRCPTCGKRHDFHVKYSKLEWHDKSDICQCKEGWLGKVLSFLAVPLDGWTGDN